MSLMTFCLSLIPLIYPPDKNFLEFTTAASVSLFTHIWTPGASFHSDCCGPKLSHALNMPVNLALENEFFRCEIANPGGTLMEKEQFRNSCRTVALDAKYPNLRQHCQTARDTEGIFKPGVRFTRFTSRTFSERIEKSSRKIFHGCVVGSSVVRWVTPSDRSVGSCIQGM